MRFAGERTRIWNQWNRKPRSKLGIAEREAELREATTNSHRSRLGHFVRWCEERGINNLNDLTGCSLHRYRIWQRNDKELSKASEKTQMDTLRVFVKWLGTIDAVDLDIHVKVWSPDLVPEDNIRDVMLEREDAKSILAHLKKYEYASLPRVTVTLLWHTMVQMTPCQWKWVSSDLKRESARDRLRRYRSMWGNYGYSAVDS